MSNLGCIYYILCKETKKGYVGQTNTPCPKKRFNQHLTSKEDSYLHKAIKKYGKDNFTIETLCIVPVESLGNMEEYYAEQLNTYIWDSPGGYNMVLCGGIPPSWSGKKHSHLTHKKMSESAKKIWSSYTEEEKSNRTQYLVGKELSDETRQKISESHIGKTLSEETKIKISKIHKGRKKSDETRQKMKNHIKSDEHKQKLRAPKSEEHRKKMSEAAKQRWAKKKALQNQDITPEVATQ